MSTWLTDLSHYATATGQLISTGPAARIAAFFARIVELTIRRWLALTP